MSRVLPWLPARPVASLEPVHEVRLPNALLGRTGNIWPIGRADGGVFSASVPKTSIGSIVGRAGGDVLNVKRQVHH